MPGWRFAKRRRCFRVSVSYIYKALIRRRGTGDSRANPNRGHRRRKLSSWQEKALFRRIETEPDITLARLQDWLLDQHGVRLSNGAIWAAVRRLGFSFKKNTGRERTGAAGRCRTKGWVAGRPAVH
jgi:transposase